MSAKAGVGSGEQVGGRASGGGARRRGPPRGGGGGLRWLRWRGDAAGHCRTEQLDHRGALCRRSRNDHRRGPRPPEQRRNACAHDRLEEPCVPSRWPLRVCVHAPPPQRCGRVGGPRGGGGQRGLVERRGGCVRSRGVATGARRREDLREGSRPLGGRDIGELHGGASGRDEHQRPRRECLAPPGCLLEVCSDKWHSEAALEDREPGCV
jgi:hypothetical protein